MDTVENHTANEVARLVLLRSEIQQEIMRLLASGSSHDEIISSGILDKRDAAEKALCTVDTSTLNDGAAYDKSELLTVNSFTFPEGDRVGLPNSMDELENTNPELVVQMSLASESWIRRLSSNEIGSVIDYAGSSIDYAKAVASGSAETAILHGAISKAPILADEVTVYSGLSTQVRDTVLSQIDAGQKIVSLGRAQSASFNPAQVNGFMSSWVGDGKNLVSAPTVALEIVTNRGAVMTRVSQAPHEMEILLPPARYEVISEMTDIMYKWSADGAGRVANRVIQLHMISE